MNLAEIERSIKGTEKSLGWVMWRLCPLLKYGLDDPEQQHEIQAQYRKVNGMVSARANLRRRAARTLGEHPELVEALAERTVARLYAHTMSRIVCTEFTPMPRPIRNARSEPVPDTPPELHARFDAAHQRLLHAELDVARLSNQIDVKPTKRRSRQRPARLRQCQR